MNIKFRPLRADELEARVATVTEKGCSVLIYKNARVDMNILDETVGAFNWQRDHKEVKGRMYCGIGIYDDEKHEWIWKWDCGTESNTEAEKGEASDAMKRSCFNWNIGRALYSAPFIWFKAGDVTLFDKGNRKSTNDRFTVDEIEYDANGDYITNLVVTNQKTKAQFRWSKPIAQKKISTDDSRKIKMMLEETNSNVRAFLGLFSEARSVDDLNAEDVPRAYKMLNAKYEKLKGDK